MMAAPLNASTPTSPPSRTDRVAGQRGCRHDERTDRSGGERRDRDPRRDPVGQEPHPERDDERDDHGQQRRGSDHPRRFRKLSVESDPKTRSIRRA